MDKPPNVLNGQVLRSRFMPDMALICLLNDDLAVAWREGDSIEVRTRNHHTAYKLSDNQIPIELIGAFVVATVLKEAALRVLSEGLGTSGIRTTCVYLKP